MDMLQFLRTKLTPKQLEQRFTDVKAELGDAQGYHISCFLTEEEQDEYNALYPQPKTFMVTELVS